jgi:hypothetical protein
MKQLLVICLLLGPACGNDGGSNGGSGIRGSIKLSELTVVQARAICRALVDYDYSTRSTEDACTDAAAEETQTVAECREYVEVCVEEDKADLEADLQDDLEECEEKDEQDRDDLQDLPADCSYTVAEYEKCNKAEIDADVRSLRRASCLDAGKLDDANYDNSDTSEECEKLFDASGQ